MSANVHYEVYEKKHQKAGWNLVLACEDRQEALDVAKEARGSSSSCSVRVSKESFDETNDIFHSTQIFSQGPEQHKRKMPENNRMDPPCSSPEDLYSLHSRRTLGRALAPWLKRNNISVIELLYRPDMAENLETAGFDRQHAIQKVAIAQAGSQECSVQHVVRRLTELADKATLRLRKIEKAKTFPKIQKKGFASTYLQAQKHKDPEFAVRYALADGLGKMKRWEDKAMFLSSCVSDILVEGQGCKNSFKIVDEFISEILALPHALDQIVGGSTLGEKLDRITDMLIGSDSTSGSDAAKTLATAITSKSLPNTQSVLAARVFRDLCGPRRLFPDDFAKEVELNRWLAERLTAIDQALAPVDRLAEAFTSRSSRLLENESIQNLLDSCKKNSAEEIRQLLVFEESILGDQNKKKLASFLRATIGSHKTRTWFAHGAGKPLITIGKIAHSQRAVRNSSFCETDQDELFVQLDLLCADVLGDTKILDKLELRDAPPIEVAKSLMKLVDGGIVTIGRVSDDICRRSLNIIRSGKVKSALQRGDKTAISTVREISTMIDRLKANQKQA
ncbi:MAG: hypothetical protein JKY46_08305 [Robiginitomaculum sp.]|nr:hypothetical protein [Robiginitomaculum sp.]